jgi:GAF domain-containing protein
MQLTISSVAGRAAVSGHGCGDRSGRGYGGRWTEREELISLAFVTLADSLIDEYDVIDLLDRLAGFCVQLLPADAAGIVLGDARRELRAVAASDEAAHVMELLQLQSNEGPCLDCFQSAAPVSVADLAEASSRWPTFVAAVEQRGDFRSVHALPLRLRGRAIGALNLFVRCRARFLSWNSPSAKR